MRQRRVLAALVLGIAAFAAEPAWADTVTITDGYWGADPTSGADKDVIGDVNVFGITKADVTRTEFTLTVDIWTGYANAYATNTGLLGTNLGDLFLSTNGWSPFGTAPYASDGSPGGINNGEAWEFALDLGNPTAGTTGGALSLYSTANGTIANSSASGTYRSGQEYRFNPTGSAVGGVTGSWSFVNLVGDPKYDVLRFTLSGVGGTSLFGAGGIFGEGDLGLHWAMSCANDVIEGVAVTTTPEPATMALLAAGLAGLGARARRRKTAA